MRRRRIGVERKRSLGGGKPLLSPLRIVRPVGRRFVGVGHRQWRLRRNERGIEGGRSCEQRNRLVDIRLVVAERVRQTAEV